jgi:broad specificity phosphatase PhoE
MPSETIKGNAMTKRFAIAATLFFALLTPCMAADPAIIYLVRHGEKLAGDDPELSPAGQLRAQNIAATLKRAGIARIYSTDTRRTRETAQPLASALNLKTELYDGSKPEAMLAGLKSLRGAALVVAHSNTLPGLVNQLGGKGGAEINEATEFDRLYQLVIERDGSVTTVLLSSLPAAP